MKPQPVWPSPWEFLKSFGVDWGERISGPLSVPLSPHVSMP